MAERVPPQPINRRTWARAIAIVVCPAVLLAGNVFLRWRLEQASVTIITFIDAFFPEAGRKFAAGSYRWWQYLLPNPDMWGSWTSTTLILTHAVEKTLTAPVTWVLYNGLVVLASFIVSIVAFDSLVF